MTIDEAIQRYADNAEYERTHGNLQGFLEFKQLAKWLKELKQLREQTKWIPCSERLPKKEKKTYWVCTDTEYQYECRWTNNRFGLGEGEWGWSIFDTPQYSKPIAWMPLPEPYKEEMERK